MATDPNPGLRWRAGAATCAHVYLWPALRATLDELGLSPRPGAPPPRVLDMGCGNGWIAARLRGLGYEVAGFDADPAGVGFARCAVPDGRFEVLVSGEELVSVFGEGWDLVVSTEVIEHLYAPRKLVVDARALLRPGGVLILTTPYHGYLKNLVLALSGRLDAHFTALWDGGHIKFWSRRTLGTLLTEAGLEVIGFRGVGRWPWLWKSMVVAARRPPAAQASCPVRTEESEC
jgi:2-polyprenyl-6-hydroxyphenyl methylase/3-demethylubiquinone-9 3-methyltransferase